MKVMHIQYNERNLKNCIQICCGIESFWYVVELQRCLKCRTFAVAKIFVFLIHYIVNTEFNLCFIFEVYSSEIVFLSMQSYLTCIERLCQN